jgi:5-(carboxyamino)imidazole ribonucleotide mutase
MAQVLIIMGSDSDLPVMAEAAGVLEELGVSFDLTVVSAHRTADRMYEYAKTAHTKGYKSIIAGAGGAAHLPGMVASLTPLYSIVQMPPGIPVATMAINGAKNAGILAAKMLGAHDAEVQTRVLKFTNAMEASVLQKAEILEEIGYKAYLESNK